MHASTMPFAIDGPLPTSLAGLFDYWRSLLRGEATMPFADDLDMTKAKGLVSDLFVVGVFEKPERFRLELAHAPNAPRLQDLLLGRFIDEIALESPLDYLRAQADAAVEGLGPTYYEHAARGDGRDYARLLLPFWGEGQVKLLLGAIEWRSAP
jgi:hypothetical protein